MGNATPPPLSAATSVRAGRHEALFQPKVIGRAEGLPGPSWLALLLSEGRAELRRDGTSEWLGAPTLIWRVWGREDSALLTPGTVAAHILIGANALSNALGHKPEAQNLRDMAERPVTVPLEHEAKAFVTLRTCFDAVHAETTEARPASATLVEAYLRILLIELWRLRHGAEVTTRRTTPGQRMFDNFVALVEGHFRERWSVASYAAALGLSRDRLGDICQRVRGKPPKAIIDQRTEREERLMLQNSTHSIEQVAGLLGFQTASQFSHFIRRRTGVPPGALRLTSAMDPAGRTEASPGLLHDWP